MTQRQIKLVENYIRKVVRKTLSETFDIEGFRNMGLHSQGQELDRTFKQKFKSIHFADMDKQGSMQRFFFMDENDNQSNLTNALKYIKEITSMSGRVGEYEGSPAIILWYN